ncbi:B12-binding domain-containing radical SAM protein [Patescibacteria group bacterium]|nr:B12-binding domain-containing radical SAM protein [Patescibacteria group bacterium]
MSKIVFINPPLFLEERYGELAQAGSMTPPLGLCGLAAVTREEGFETKIIDAAAQSLSHRDTVQRIVKTGFPYVGITATTLSIYSAGKLAGLIKKISPETIIIIGGCHVTALPEDTMKKFPSFDIGVLGEGEITIVNVLKALEQKKNLRKVKGIIFRKNKKLVKTMPQEILRDLDKLPLPAWDLLPNLISTYRPAAFNCQKLPSVSLITSRGCTGKCVFCSRAVAGIFWRGYSAKYIILMIKKLIRDYGIREVKIFDDNFVVSKERVREFCRLIKKERLNLSWSCSARIDLVNFEILKTMKDAGCWQIFYGIESGSQKVLDVLGKGIKLKEIERTVNFTNKAGIKVVGSFMVGNPCESLSTIRKTIDFAKRLPLNDFQMSIFTPLPGSEIYDTAGKYGVFDKDWRKMNLWYPVFIPYGLKKEDLWEYQKVAFREFYFRPRLMLSYFARIKSKEHLLALWGGLGALVKMQLKQNKSR